MEAFKTEPNVEVLLVSLRAGGVGYVPGSAFSFSLVAHELTIE